MKVYEHDQEIELNFAEEDTLQNVIAVLDNRANEKNMIVSEIRVDDVLVDAGNEREFDEKTVKDINKLEIKVEEETALISRALNETYHYLPRLAQGLEDISVLFQAGSRNEAFDKFTECLNGWIQIINLLQSIEKIKGLAYADINLKEGTVKEANEKLLGLLQQTKAAMENDDIVSLSDLIEYELSPMAQQQMEIVQKLIDILNAPQAGPAEENQESLN